MVNRKQFILVAAAAAVAIFVLYYSLGRKPAGMSAPGEQPTSTVAAEPASSTSVAPGQNRAQSSPAATMPASTPQIKIISPAASDKWVIGQSNLIQWNKEAGISGAVYLLDASDKSVVGVINSETGPHQVSFAWTTQDVFLSRSNPYKKGIVPGSYIIKIAFDNKPPTTASSPTFSIIYPSQVQISEYTLIIKNYAFSPASLAVAKGSRLNFVNNDSVTHNIILSTFSPFVIPPGGSYAFDTSILVPGTYIFYSADYQTLRATITVQ